MSYKFLIVLVLVCCGILCLFIPTSFIGFVLMIAGAAILFINKQKDKSK